MNKLTKTVLTGVLLCSFMASAAILWKAFNSVPAAANFCAETHCISIENMFGNEFPMKRYIVVYDSTNPDQGCTPKLENGVLSCAPPIYDPNE